MPSRRLTHAALEATVTTMAVATAVTPAVAAPAAGVTVRTPHVLVRVGPDRAMTCDGVGDPHTPRPATSTHEVPAVLTTNGSGGSEADQQPFAPTYAAAGHVV